MLDNRSPNCFSSSYKQRAMMHMRICRHCWQTGGRKISLAAIFRHHFFYKTLMHYKTNLSSLSTFSKQISFSEQFNKFVKLRKGPIYPSNQTHGDVTFLEIARWLVKRMIIVIASRWTNAVVINTTEIPWGFSTER